MKRTPRHFAFGPYIVDGLRGVLWEHATPVQLTPRVFELLVVLIEHHGEDLGKDELIQQVWGGTVVEENNLARHISTLRKALHERPGQRDYIATIPGVGYRFVAEVIELEKLPAELIHAPVRRAEAPTADAGNPATSVDAPARSNEPQPAVPVPPPDPGAAARQKPTHLWIAAAGTALVAAAATLILVAYTQRAAAPAKPVQRTLSEFTFDSGWQRDPAWSPDGRAMAYASDRDGNFDIWIQNLDGSLPRQLTKSAYQESEPSWSPDSKWLVFRSERDGGGLYVVPAEGGTPERIASFGSRPVWAPSGDRILFSAAPPDTAGATKLYVASRDGQSPQPIVNRALKDFNAVSAAWHPDGRVSVWGRDATDVWTFLTISLETGAVVHSALPPDVRAALADGGPALGAFTWAPGARQLYFEGRTQSIRNIWRVTVDPVSLAWDHEPERLTNGPGSDTAPAVSPDGRRMAFGIASGRTAMWSFAFDSVNGKLAGAGRAETSGDVGERGADAWMDGRRLVYLSSRNDRQEMWERSQGEVAPRLLLSNSTWNHSRPRWSRDGTQIAYARTRRGSAAAPAERSVAVLAVNTRDERVFPLSGAMEVIPADWSPDGHSLLSACRLVPADRIGTCVMSLDSADREGGLKRLWTDSRANMFQMRWSPNQRWISFTAVQPTERSIAQIYVMPAAGGPWTPITDGAWYDDKPRWGADGRTLYFISNRGGRSDVWGRRLDPETGQPTSEMFRVTSFEQGHQIISPYLDQLELNITARRIFLPMHEATGQIWILDQVDR